MLADELVHKGEDRRSTTSDGAPTESDMGTSQIYTPTGTPRTVSFTNSSRRISTSVANTCNMGSQSSDTSTTDSSTVHDPSTQSAPRDTIAYSTSPGSWFGGKLSKTLVIHLGQLRRIECYLGFRDLSNWNPSTWLDYKSSFKLLIMLGYRQPENLESIQLGAPTLKDWPYHPEYMPPGHPNVCKTVLVAIDCRSIDRVYQPHPSWSAPAKIYYASIAAIDTEHFRLIAPETNARRLKAMVSENLGEFWFNGIDHNVKESKSSLDFLSNTCF